MQSLETDGVVQLISRIYEASLEASIWPDVVREIGRLQKASKSLLLTPFHAPDAGGFVFPEGISEQAMQLWAEKYIRHDLWSQALVDKELYVEGQVIIDEELVSHEELQQSVWYREFLSNIRIARLCTGIVFGLHTPGTLPAALSLYRDASEPAFGDSERQFNRMLVPHLSRSLGIMFRLRDSELRVAATLAALDRLNSGVVLIGAQRAVTFSNRAASDALAEEDGLRLRLMPTGRGFLTADSIDAQRTLDAALDQCLDPAAINVAHFSQVVAIPRQSGRAAYLLNVSALPQRNEFGTGPEQPRAIAFLTDPANPVHVDEESLHKLYGLTAAECRLAEQVCMGQSIASIAGTLGVSENTVKKQLQSIFEKTGTHRQAQLVKLVLSLSSRS